jgi:hypothetical protein
MRRVRFEPETDTKRQVILSTDLTAMQDLPAKYVHTALKLLNLTSATGAGLRIKIFGLQAIPASTPDKTVSVTAGAGAVGGTQDEDSPIVELAANKQIFILDDASVLSETPTKIKKNSIVFVSDVIAAGAEVGFKVKENPTGTEKTIIAFIGTTEVVVEEDMTPDAAPAVAATIRKPGKAADPTLARIDVVSIGPNTVETDDDFANADETRDFVDVNVKEGAGGRETTKDIRTRYEDAFVIFVRQGEPAVSPIAPVVPADELPIAQVAVGAGVTVINEIDITDIDEGATQFDDRFPVTFFDITAAENLDDFDIIRIRSSDANALKADYTSRENSKVIGIIPSGGAIDIITNPKGQASHFGIFTKVGAGLSPGRHLYLLSDGKFGHEEAFLASGQIHKVPVGMAITAEKFIFFGGRRVMAEDIPLEDSAGNYSSINVEDALAESAVAAAGGLKFIGHNQALSTAPATVIVPAGAAPNRLLIHIHIHGDQDGRLSTGVVKNGSLVNYPGTSLPMIVQVDNDFSGRSAVSGHFLLVAGTEYDPNIANTFSNTGLQFALNAVTTITILGS